jgi:hypothetical protein
MLSILKFSAVIVASCASVAFIGSAAADEKLDSYINNKNVTTLDRLLTEREVDRDILLKSALFSGFAITYDFALEPGGSKKFQSFMIDCYDKAFSSGEMVSILGCYVAVNVVVSQIERITDSDLKELYDQFLVDYFAEQGIAEKVVLDEVITEFTVIWKKEYDWMQTLTVKQVEDCLEYGVSKQCSF